MRKSSLCSVVGLCAAVACAAPISTQRSPMHLRVIELRNDTDRELVLAIEPTADQKLEAPTTFTGRFEPGETKILYVYHGLRYQVDVLEPNGDPVTRGIFQVDHDIGLAFGGDSLGPAARLAVRLGVPTLIVADSLPRSMSFDVEQASWSPPRGRYRLQEGDTAPR
ncbi:MAG: hypothetical protein ACRDX9_04030 [Acidimicrobiia bacterium]